MDIVTLRAFQLLRMMAGGWLASLCVVSVQTINSLPNLCLYRHFTGSPCLGCGLTHSVWFLLRGQFATAIQWNRLGFLVLPVAVVFAIGGWPMKTIVTGRGRR